MRRRPRARGILAARLAVGVAALTALTGAALPTPAAPSVDRALVVRAPASMRLSTLRHALPSAITVRRIAPIGRGIAVVDVRTPASVSAATAARLFVGSGAVWSAAPDTRFSAQATHGATPPVSAADSDFAAQWALWDATSTARAGGYGIDAPRAWERTTGSASVVVAVLDTGITAHPNLTGMHRVPGYDFVGAGTADADDPDADIGDDDPTDTGDACTESGSTSDSSWHGTFVTGEIAAQPGAGVAGAAPGVAVEPVRVLGPCGGSESATIRGLLWAAGLPVQVTDADGNTVTVPANANPAQVISMSLGGSGVCDDAMQTAVAEAIAAGSVVVAAAGNDGGPIANSSPADCAGVVSVVATDRQGHVASYSDTGTTAVPATIAAPGGDIVAKGSGFDRSALMLGDSWSDTGAYTGLLSHASLQYDAGTSMATPLVSASIALLRSEHPEYSTAQVVARLTATATPFPAAAGCTPAVCGAGIVNAGDLLGAPRVFVLASAPSVTGRARVGSMLKATAGVWHGKPATTAYQWMRNGKAVRGETHAQYRLHAKDRGQRIAVQVTVRAPGTTTKSATSAAVRVSH